MCRPIPWILCISKHIKCSKTDLAVPGPSPGPLFCYADDCPLTRQLLLPWVQSILHLADLLSSYSGRSFRICAATTAASPGLFQITWLRPWVMHISAISVHQLALLSRFQSNWRSRYCICGLFCYWGWCLRYAPLGTVAYWPRAPITPGWVSPEVPQQGRWGSWLGCR